MSATAVAIGSVVVTAIIALIVPWLAFRWALRQDHDRLIARIRVGEVMDKLEAAVRHELGADRIRLRDPG